MTSAEGIRCTVCRPLRHLIDEVENWNVKVGGVPDLALEIFHASIFCLKRGQVILDICPRSPAGGAIALLTYLIFQIFVFCLEVDRVILRIPRDVLFFDLGFFHDHPKNPQCIVSLLFHPNNGARR